MTHAGEQRPLSIALAQMDVVLGDVPANIAQATRWIDDAAQRGAELVLLPELWSTGYDLAHGAAHCATTRAEVVPAMAALARRHGVYLHGSVLLDDEHGRARNVALLVGPEGAVRSEYAKIHLFAMMDEDRYLAPGDAAPTFSLADTCAAAAICYDLRFPELFRTYALAGATLILLPAEWPAVRLEHWRTLVRARAIENQCFIAACNRVGTSGSTAFGGHSMVVDPWGTVLTEGGETETLLMATIDPRRVLDTRAAMNILGDRRPELYDLSFQPAHEP